MDNGQAARVPQNIIEGATEIIKYEHFNIFLKGLYDKKNLSNVLVNGIGSLVLALLLLFQVFANKEKLLEGARELAKKSESIRERSDCAAPVAKALRCSCVANRTETSRLEPWELDCSKLTKI